jgi:hypothetical protein
MGSVLCRTCREFCQRFGFDAIPFRNRQGKTRFLNQWFTAVHFWMATVAGLSLLGVYILLRGTLRLRAA